MAGEEKIEECITGRFLISRYLFVSFNSHFSVVIFIIFSFLLG